MMDRVYKLFERRALICGAMGWVVFSAVAVALRGVRWEEAYEHALVITRTVPYPEGHPFFLYCRNVFSGQSYLAALMLLIADSPLLINGLRNGLQLVFATVPVYLIGARFGRHVIAGHAAAVLVLLGVHVGFQSYYPIESWPHFFATGQIGAGYALLVLALLLWGRWRTAWFLLGLMPAIHIGQLPVIGLFAGLQWLVYLQRRDGARVKQALGYFAVGLAPCIVFYLVQRQFHVDPPVEGAYFAQGDVTAIWVAYTERHDLHRGFPRLNPFWKSWIAVALVLLVSTAGASETGNDPNRWNPFRWTLLFALLVGGVVGGIWIAHQVLGPRAPFLLIGWMPYRLTNHLAILLVPLACGLLWRGVEGDDRGRTAARLLLGGVLFYAVLLPLWGVLLPEALFTRYAGNVELLSYLLCGGAIAVAVIGTRDSGLRTAIGFAGALLAATLISAYPFALAGLIAGALGYFALHVLSRRAPVRFLPWSKAITAGLCALLLASLVIQQTRTRENLPLQPIHRAVAAWLDQHGEPDAMILAPYWDVNWLAKTHRPIFADYQTAHLMSYLPALAPVLKKMHAEVYGIDIDGDGESNLDSWPGRSAQEWQQLADTYGFRYILAPAEMPLQLECVLPGAPYNLYRVQPTP